ncbi:hypothetical protein [Entomospira culicis]|uniref:Uncharacterized protein n=1 Tax=Entomospira culicis TaxID=2719989 RepID=A0A968GI28_9SPIO|nr:hypothetical protein [Entomospira culicis]NIZ19160.1 hypothetical protein [Entomospira culicis]NIZ69374.1 hypothetical protein [Entomospira culicis]WDI36491.1 hypothetical protein PVA46_03990 [Entomospira culicis]WDI38117.1 hypothetical protein PVA47_03990 [Entomospira culicis]
MAKKSSYDIDADLFAMQYFNCYKQWYPLLREISLLSNKLLLEKQVDTNMLLEIDQRIYNPIFVRNSLLFAYSMYQWREPKYSLEPITVSVEQRKEAISAPERFFSHHLISFGNLHRDHNDLLNIDLRVTPSSVNMLEELIPFNISHPHQNYLDGFFFEILFTYYVDRQNLFLNAYFENLGVTKSQCLKRQDFEYIATVLQNYELPNYILAHQSVVNNLRKALAMIKVN